MPHIHTGHGQHDLTTSGYIVRLDGDEPRCLVHMHKKIGKLMQMGGHVELTETPWAAISHELSEETGYTLAELRVLQPTPRPAQVHNAVVHPVPVLFNTHKISDTHYHTDICYAFVATADPASTPQDGESVDIRWCSLTELRSLQAQGVALADSVEIYDAIVGHYLKSYYQVDTELFSIDDPQQHDHLS